MKDALQPGVAFELCVRITPAMCPHFDGILVHPVCATWEVVRYMEVAGRGLLAPHLADDEEAVGARIDVDHRSPAIVGSEVRFRAEVESWQRHRLICRVSAWCGARLLANGNFVQVLIPKARLQALLDRHRGDVQA